MSLTEWAILLRNIFIQLSKRNYCVKNNITKEQYIERAVRQKKKYGYEINMNLKKYIYFRYARNLYIYIYTHMYFHDYFITAHFIIFFIALRCTIHKKSDTNVHRENHKYQNKSPVITGNVILSVVLQFNFNNF